MKLVFVTQVLDRDDAVLGFVMRWVQGLAKEAESVRVLALEVGSLEGLPSNVDVRVIGRRGYVGRYLRYRGFLKKALEEGFDGLLTHMVPRYSTLAAGLARRAGAAHYLWYTHKGVDRRLLSAIEVVDGAFTASELSLRVETPKKIVTGHGIDLAHFDVSAGAALEGESDDRPVRLLSVGRLTPAKDPLTTIEALALLRDRGHRVELTWAGSTLARGDDEYETSVRKAVSGRDLTDAVKFVGAVPYPSIPAAFEAADLVINASGTGSVDKVVLESMAARRPFVSCNESIPPVLEVHDELRQRSSEFTFVPHDAPSLADRLEAWIQRSTSERQRIGGYLREIVAQHHEVDALMARIVRKMETR